MPKRPLKLHIRIPAYAHPRNDWRRAIHKAIQDRQQSSPVRYSPDDKLEVRIYLSLDKRQVGVHDVDNRLKDCLDALQGRAGGSKKRRSLEAIIPNDRQIYRVVIEKGIPPKQARGLGHLTIRRFPEASEIAERARKRAKLSAAEAMNLALRETRAARRS